MNENSFAKAGTAGGTIIVILMNIITTGHIIKTAILAAVGAIVSFGVSYVLKWVIERRKR